MLKTIDDKHFKRKDYVEALKRLEACISISEDSFGFTNEDIDLKDLTEEYYSDIKEIRAILKRMSSSCYWTSPNEINKNKRIRLAKDKRKLRKLYMETKNSYPSAVIKKEDKFLVRFYCSNTAKRFYKSLSNRLVRRTSNKFVKNFGTYSICKGASYKRVFDYYWTIY